MTTEEKIIKNKLGLLNLTHQLGNVLSSHAPAIQAKICLDEPSA